MPCLRLLFILMLLPVSGFSQEKYLALDKPGRVKRIRFYTGDEIALKLKGDKRLYEEVIANIGDSTITLLGTQIPLRDIRAIVVRHEGGLAHQAVRKLPIAGLLYFLAATFNPLLQGQPLRVNRSGLIVGGAMVAGGQLLRPLLKRTYRINSFRRLRTLQTY